MFKLSNLDLRYSESFIRNSGKSKWFALLVLSPLAIFAGYQFFQPQLLTFVASLFPPEPDKSLAFYRDFLQLIFTEMLWISGFFLLSWIFIVYVPLPVIVDKMTTLLLKRSIAIVFVIAGLSFIFSIIIANATLEVFPNSSDEYAYVFQAKTIGDGKLWERAHEHHEFFYSNHIAHKDGLRVSRFPPGWPLVLSTAYFLGFPAFLVNPLLGFITLLVFYFFARRFYSEQVAIWSLVALALSSFYIFNSASFFSHTSCALFALSFVFCVYLYFEKYKPVYAIGAGFFLGMIAITRYYTALLLFIPFLFYILYRYRTRSIVAFFWIGVGSAPCIIFLLWYNYTITGSPFVPVTVWAYEDETLGFVKGHSFIKGIEHVIRWIFMFFYWCSPALLILYFTGLFRKIKVPSDRAARPEDYFFIVLMAGYFFYYQIGGNQYGPRFFFEALPFLVLFVVNRIFVFRKKLPLAFFCAGLVYAVVKIPFIAIREHRVIEERKDLYNAVNDSNISNAVVFISSHTGLIRPMPKGDLTRNDIHYKNDVLYALDMNEKNDVLMRYYPGKTFYRYVKEKEDVNGKLIRIK